MVLMLTAMHTMQMPDAPSAYICGPIIPPTT
jgi:hypothetical protein